MLSVIFVENLPKKKYEKIQKRFCQNILKLKLIIDVKQLNVDGKNLNKHFLKICQDCNEHCTVLIKYREGGQKLFAKHDL